MEWPSTFKGQIGQVCSRVVEEAQTNLDLWEIYAIEQTSSDIIETQRTIIGAMGHVMRLNQVNAKLLGKPIPEPEYATDIRSAYLMGEEVNPE